jgi:hypothetical protein
MNETHPNFVTVRKLVVQHMERPCSILICADLDELDTEFLERHLLSVKATGGLNDAS